jgi:D-alanine-D-alanine ligase
LAKILEAAWPFSNSSKNGTIPHMKNILIFFGGSSPEREVAVITGLQLFEYIDRTIYQPIAIYVSEEGQFFLLDPIKNRKDFSLSSKMKVYFGYDAKEKIASYFTKTSDQRPIYAAINTCHGGDGEAGPLAGFFQSYHIPYTSTNVESSVLCMNKVLAKEAVSKVSIPVVTGVSVSSYEISKNIKSLCANILTQVDLPLIIKPAHLGSSIGIKIARTAIELELGLLEVSHLDTQIVVEKFLENISEFNCSIRTIGGEVQTSEIERPLSKTEILSFAEKYEKGGKKVGGGMASLSRELPAHISEDVHTKIETYSKEIYRACKCKGVVRVDFIQAADGQIFFNEINPIPGSLAFYLWEASGIPFEQQISELIEESILDDAASHSINYIHRTDIIKNFIENYTG